jgi:hypothetical protein
MIVFNLVRFPHLEQGGDVDCVSMIAFSNGRGKPR